MSARSAPSSDVASLDRHRSPSATQIYTSARSYLRNNSDCQELGESEHGQLFEYENHDKANIKSERAHSSPDTSQVKSIKQKGKSDKIKRGSRRRSSSTESSDLFGDIPRPSQTDRSRSVEITGGIARIELERSKTDSVTALGYNDGVLDYTSDKDELATSIKPNTERALLAQAAASSTRLMSLSLGRGQPIPSPAQAASTLTAAESQSLPSGRSDLSTSRAEGEEDPPSEQPSIESYIGQSFPLVKNIDKTVVESVTKYDVSQPYRFQGSQPQPASVISDHDYNYVQTTPPYDQKGKRSHRQKKAFKSSSIDTAGLIAAASESTKPLLYSDVRGSIVTPPRKVGTLQDGFDHQSPALKSAATSRSSSPMVDSDRLQQSLSRSGGQSRLRDVSVVSSGASCVPVQVSVLATTTSTNAAPAGPTGSRNSRAVGNDSTLQQRLQEAKALSRKDDGSNGGAVMHKFSLWKGVEKRAPLVDPPKTAGNGEAGNVGLGPVDSGGVRKHSTDSASSGTADVAPPKKSSRVKKGVPSARQSSEEAIEATTPPVRLAKLKHRKAPKPAHNFPPDNYSSSTKSKCRVKIGAVVQSEADFEVASDGSIDEVSSEDESNALAMTSGGRASAFRNMVGICKTHNSSTGSLTESVKTELGSIMVHATETSNSVDTVQYSDDEEFEYIGFEDPEPAILGIAVEECSMLSEEGDGDYIDKLVEDDEDMKPIDMTREKLKNHILSPESSSSSLAYSHSHDGSVCNTAAKYKKDIRIDSIEAVEQVSRVAAFSPVVEISPSEPPPLRKGEKTMPLFNMDPLATQAAVGMSGEASSSVSLSRLPTERRSTSSRQKQADKSETNPVEKHSAQTNGRHKVKSRGPERIGKDEKEKNDPLNSSVHKRDDGSLSPALSEVSDMEPDKEDTQPFSIAITKAAPPRTLITHATKQPEEIFTIKDFQWKKGSEIIGEGTFGQVYKGLNCSTGELLAVKQISLTDGTEEEVRTLRKEIDLMQDLVHPNIVRYVGTSVSSRYLFIVLEYVPGGCVAGMLSQFGAFSEILIRRLVSQIMQGVDYLHQKGIVHRDIKGGNVLVSDTGVAKLADFGCSKQLAGLCTTSLEESMRTIRGSVPWMAPEVIKQQGHGRSADIWSVGATIIEMATAKHPWPEFSNNLAALFHVATSKYPPPIPEHLSSDCANFIKRCMNIDPKLRSTAKELLSDPFLLSLIITSNP